ncbi:MFS transporter [Exiguobacterium sp. SRB7LM]|uniref:MFS transporter n=1 Tax=Exiguobacterium sp. SRB7LM TaxID=2608401 RepID=UPI0018C420C7|nr:MFS transporter [Exiguobacterium sp. SRB7LM]
MFQSLHPNLKIRLGLNFFQKLTQTAIFPFLTIYFVRQFGATETGPLIFLTMIASFITSLYGGLLSDRYGRKRVLFIGEMLRFVCFIGMAIAGSHVMNSAVLLFIFFFLSHLLSSAITPANEAILIDDSRPEQRKYLYTLSYWIMNGSIVIGSLIGGFFFEQYLLSLLVSTAFLSFGCVFFIYLKLEDHYQPVRTKSRKTTRMWTGYETVIKNRLFLKYLIAGILTLSLELQLTHYLAIHFAETLQVVPLFHFSLDGTSVLGLLRAENTILVLLLGLVLMRWTQSISERALLYTGVTLFSLGFAILPVSNDFSMLVLATACFTFGELLYVPIHQAMLARLIEDHLRSQYLAVNGLRYRGALLIGAISVSAYNVVSPGWMAITYICFGILAIFFYRSILKELDKCQPLELKKAS